MEGVLLDPVILRNSDGDLINPATEEKQDVIIDLLKNGNNIPEYDYREINYTTVSGIPVGISSIVFKKLGVIVATINFAEVSTTLTTIAKSE